MGAHCGPGEWGHTAGQVNGGTLRLAAGHVVEPSTPSIKKTGKLINPNLKIRKLLQLQPRPK
eukprot:299362-Chlamydomonas_euryale.AAC.2